MNSERNPQLRTKKNNKFTGIIWKVSNNIRSSLIVAVLNYAPLFVAADLNTYVQYGIYVWSENILYIPEQSMI